MMSLIKQNALLHTAEKEFIDMLQLGAKMFNVAVEPIVGEKTDRQVEDFHSMDKKINKRHRDVRRKLFEHLSFSGGQDLFPSLVLLSVVDDSERIGDYIKNIAEILAARSNKLDIGAFDKDLKNICEITNLTFAHTLDAFVQQDEKLAEKIVMDYKKTATTCDSVLHNILKTKDDKVGKDHVALALLLRYLKRINAHLKNIASSVVNPFHRIGYKVKKQD